MKNKLLKESIQKSIKENILQEKITDIPGQIGAGIANMGRNIAGQYHLGGIDSRMSKVSKRIKQDWDDSANYVVQKAQKLAQSKNPMIAKQGQLNLQKVDNASKAINQAVNVISSPADTELKQGQDDQFAKHQSQIEFEDWLKNSGVAIGELSKVDRGRYLRKWQEMKILGLDPSKVPMQDMQREIAIAAHRRNLSMKQLDAILRQQNPHKIGLGDDFVEGGDEGGEEAEDISHEIPPAPPNQQKSTKEPQKKGSMFQDLMAKQKAMGKVPQKPPLPPRGSPQNDPYANATIPSLDKKNATQGNVVPPRPLPGPAPQPGMQSPSPKKGLASPPPPRPPLAPHLQPKAQPEAPEQPVPLTKVKPYQSSEGEPIPLTKQKRQFVEMPPREERAVPHSIRGMLPPIKDDGKQIQVGSEENPAISPREDMLKAKKPKRPAGKPANKPSELEKLKSQAEKSKNPKDIEAFKKAVAKDETKKNKKQ